VAAKKTPPAFPDRQPNVEWHFLATPVENHDGDTISVIAKLPLRVAFGSVQDPLKIRFAGIDTPEMDAEDTKVRALAVKAQQFVAARLGLNENSAKVNCLVYTYKSSLKTGERVLYDVYGRILGDVYYPKSIAVDGSVAEWGFLNRELVEAGLAKVATDKKRQEWTANDA
jgi:endonuclease YncB( thermonuclease family)